MGPVARDDEHGLAPSDAIERARRGDRQAFDELCAAYGKAVYGAIRVRVASDDDARDVLQETWLQVWQKLPTFDPARGSFQAFAKYWSSVMVLRYYDAMKSRRVGEVVASELAARYPAIAGEEGMAGVLDHLGARRTEPEEPAIGADVYANLLRVTMSSASPPHQLIAFGFSKISAWTPRRITAELSTIPLRDLEARLEHLYLEESQLPPALVQPCFVPLRARLELPFEAVAESAKTLATYSHLRGQVVGDTTLQDYYTANDPTGDVTAWWYAVQRRVRAELQRVETGPLSDLLRRMQLTVARRASGRVR